MKVAILYMKPKKVVKSYPLDCAGRDGVKHILRVKQALNALGYKPYLIHIDLNSYQRLRKSRFDLAFNLCDDGFRNDPLLEAHIPALLDVLQVPYTGSGFLSLATCVNKARTKEILTFYAIPTPEFQVFHSNNEELSGDLSFPLIVKPLYEDGGIGIKRESVVNNHTALVKRVAFILKNYKQPALVEKFIVGREFYVGILGSKENLLVLPISEVIFDPELAAQEKFCSYEAKWIEKSREYKATPVQCPAKVNNPQLEQSLVELAKKAYNALGCKDYGRVDFRIDENNQPYVLEVNPNPDISEDAGLATMGRAFGLSYEQLIERIMRFAIEKNQLANKT